MFPVFFGVLLKYVTDAAPLFCPGKQKHHIVVESRWDIVSIAFPLGMVHHANGPVGDGSLQALASL